MKLFEEDYIIKAGDGLFYLDDIFNQVEYNHIYGDMLNTKRNRISFLNKSMCGNGGTTGYIRYAQQHNKGLLILVPYVSICRSKESDDGVCCVYGGSDSFDRNAQIVVATYDQYPRLLRELNMSGDVITKDDVWKMDYWSGRSIIVDECQQLMKESGYRDICVKITELVQRVSSPVVLMSATPDINYISLLKRMMPDREIYRYDVEYEEDFSTRIQVWSGKEKDLKDTFHTMLDSDNNKQICVFINSVDTIRDILDKIGDDRCEVLCSKTRDGDVGDYYSEQFNPDKKMHFLTSAYFVGCDINPYVDQVVIVGDCEFERMCLGVDDIKQIIGRFRWDISNNGVKKSGIQLFYLNKKKDQKNYLSYQNTFEKSKQVMKVMELLGDNWTEYPDYVRELLTYHRTKDILDLFEMWETRNGVEKALSDYGYIVKYKGELKDFIPVKKKTHLTFKEARKRVAAGLTVKFEEYPDVNELVSFRDVMGVSKLITHNTTKSYIHNWYKVYTATKDREIDFDRDDMMKVLGLRSFGRYNAKYLKACLDYMGYECSYDDLSQGVYEKMGCWCVPWKFDEKKNKQNNCYLIIENKMGSFPKFLGSEYVSLYIYKKKKDPRNLGKDPTSTQPIIDMKVSYKTGFDHHTGMTAKTITFKQAIKEGLLSNLTGYDLYNRVEYKWKTNIYR